MIKNYKLNIHEFPRIIEIIQQKFLHWAIKSKPWYIFEENFSQNDNMLGQIALVFFQRRKNKEETKDFAKAAYSLVVRYNLLTKYISNIGPLQDMMKRYKEFSAIPILKNPIFENDIFSPREENIGTVPPETFINLKSFDVTENDVIYVENFQDDNFIIAKNLLENADIVLYRCYLHYIF